MFRLIIYGVISQALPIFHFFHDTFDSSPMLLLLLLQLCNL